MPKQYTEIKKSYLRRGVPLQEAKRIAAMTFIKKGGDPKALHHKKRKRRHGRSVGDDYTGRYLT